MAIVDCKIHQKRGTFRIDNESIYTYAYWVNFDANTDPATVYADAQTASPDPLPKEYDGHPTDTSAYVLSVDIRERHPNDFQHWEAIVNYGKLPPGQDADRADNPLFWPVRYRVDYKLVSKIVTVDANGEPLLNTARDPIVNPPRMDFEVPVLIAEKNYATLDEIVELGYQYRKTTNSATWFGAQPGQAQFQGVRAGEQQILDGQEYYTGTISVVIDYDAETDHTVLLDNLGWRAWDNDPDWLGGSVVDDTFFPTGNWRNKNAANPNSATIELAIADNGEPSPTPVYLTQTGQQWTPGGDDPVFYVASQLLTSTNYTAIGIGG